MVMPAELGPVDATGAGGAGAEGAAGFCKIGSLVARTTTAARRAGLAAFTHWNEASARKEGTLE